MSFSNGSGGRIMKSATLFLLIVLQTPLILTAQGTGDEGELLQAWIADPHRRVFYGSFGQDLRERRVKLEAARNELALFQLAVKSAEDIQGLRAETADLEGEGQSISRRQVRVRYPGFLPVDENGQYTPDPLVLNGLRRPRNGSYPAHLDRCERSRDAAPGTYRGTVTLVHDGQSLEVFEVQLEVLSFPFPASHEDHFYFNILMDVGSIARMHKVERWSEAHWSLIEKYVQNLADHSQDAIVVFFIEDPWEGRTGFPRIQPRRVRLPGAWEDIENPRFEFDYSNFDRFVRMCLAAGIDQNLQAWSPVNMAHKNYSVIHYQDTSAGETRQFKVVAGTAGYEHVWGQFAESFAAHLRERGWLEITTVGLDESAPSTSTPLCLSLGRWRPI